MKKLLTWLGFDEEVDVDTRICQSYEEFKKEIPFDVSKMKPENLFTFGYLKGSIYQLGRNTKSWRTMSIIITVLWVVAILSLFI